MTSLGTAETGVEYRAFRFAFNAKAVVPSEEWVIQAQRLESMGFSTLVMADHFSSESRSFDALKSAEPSASENGPSQRSGETRDPTKDTFAPYSALAFAAARTTTLRLGVMVFCNDYRNPAVLTKEAATLDVLSRGRFELGIGAGYLDADYRNLGLQCDPPARRVQRLLEAIPVIKDLMANDRVEPGPLDNYQIRSMNGPLSFQRPHCPILIGARRPRMLAVAGRHADIVGVQTSDEMSLRRRVETVLEAGGERARTIEYNVNCRPGDECHGPVLGGTVQQMADHLRRQRAESGISYLGFSDVSGGAEQWGPLVDMLAGQ